MPNDGIVFNLKLSGRPLTFMEKFKILLNAVRRFSKTVYCFDFKDYI